MPRITGSVDIERPIVEVFDFVADEEHEPLYNTQMLSARRSGTGPIGVGASFHVVVQGVGGKSEMDITYIEYERPRLLTSVTQVGGMEIAGSLRFEELGHVTRMHWNWDIRPHGVMSAFGPVITWQGRRQEERIWHSLKRYLEASAGS